MQEYDIELTAEVKSEYKVTANSAEDAVKKAKQLFMEDHGEEVIIESVTIGESFI